jgi:hypothetical protein
LALDLSETLKARENQLDTIEGMTLGPKLPDGRQAIVLVSDNNFSHSQVTQFLLVVM